MRMCQRIKLLCNEVIVHRVSPSHCSKSIVRSISFSVFLHLCRAPKVFFFESPLLHRQQGTKQPLLLLLHSWYQLFSTVRDITTVLVYVTSDIKWSLVIISYKTYKFFQLLHYKFGKVLTIIKWCTVYPLFLDQNVDPNDVCIYKIELHPSCADSHESTSDFGHRISFD